MNISIKGKHVDVGEALRGHAMEYLTATVAKYFERAMESNIVFSREGYLFRADISVHARRGIVMQGHSSADDAYTAFDKALDRVAKQLRRHKRRLRDHHKSQPNLEILPAQYSIIASASEEGEALADSKAVIIAEIPHEVATLTVGEAVTRMESDDAPIMMFRNRAHGGFNVIYRRDDGNIGWIDPKNTQET
jgi:ribosomal subunit interface protein